MTELTDAIITDLCAELERLRGENAQLLCRIDELTAERDDLQAKLAHANSFGIGAW